MRLRPVILSALAIGLVASSSALASTKQVCKLITDNEGDGRHAAVGVLSSPALDILSADVATGRKDVKGVLRLKSVDTSTDPLAYLGLKWTLAFQIQATNVSFAMTRSTSVTGVRDSASARVGDDSVDAIFAVDPRAHTITFTVPRKAFATTLVKKPGKLDIENIAATSYLMGGNADLATGPPNTKYRDLTPSCLKAA